MSPDFIVVLRNISPAALNMQKTRNSSNFFQPVGDMLLNETLTNNFIDHFLKIKYTIFSSPKG